MAYIIYGYYVPEKAIREEGQFLKGENFYQHIEIDIKLYLEMLKSAISHIVVVKCTTFRTKVEFLKLI